MTSASARRTAPCILVIFGATGDLTRRKLVPSLTNLQREKLLPESFAIIGFARRDKSDEVFRDEMAAACETHGRKGCGAAFHAMRQRIHYHRSTFEDATGYDRLRERLDAVDAEHGTQHNRIFYLATPPSAYSGILRNLKDAGLSDESEGYARVVIEKPFGRDRQSAHDLNEQVAAAFDEDQVYRIDHYLGKETVQNILAMRFANRIFEPTWNVRDIDHVQITVAESIGVEGRGAYFEESGIIRDMIQNHLLQVLTLIAMEPPVNMTANAVRDEKVKVLQAVKSFKRGEGPRNTVRAQYEGYLDEPGVRPDSTTETFAAIRLEIDNWRWNRTPFFLRAGKALPKRVTEVAICYRRAPQHLFGDKANRNRNALLLKIQPDEGISLRFGSKQPGPDANIQDVHMDFDYDTTFAKDTADAYQRLLLDAMHGDSTLFARRDEVDEAWRIVDSVIDAWADQPTLRYAAGSWGPEAAEGLLRKDRTWRRP